MTRSCRVRWSTAIPWSINSRWADWRLIWIWLPGSRFATYCKTGAIYYQLFAKLTQSCSEKHHSGKMSGPLEVLLLYHITPLQSFWWKRNKIALSSKKSGNLFCRLQIRRIFILRAHIKKALCCVWLWRGKSWFCSFLSGTTALEIIQDIHEVYIGVIRRVIGIKIFMHIAVSKIFCAHIIKMVRCL